MANPTARVPSLALIVPVHRTGPDVRRCLSAIRGLNPAPDECVLVADGMDQAGKAWIRRACPGARVEVSAGRGGSAKGPAAARNLGARSTDAEVLWFVDSDVGLPRSAAARLRRLMTRFPMHAAVFGSYDGRPGDRGTVSQFRNLLHHFVHQRAAGEAVTFWAGCGAVRRRAFESVGGFDDRFRAPGVEDIDLGYRLKRAGYRLRLEKSLQGRHWKRWTVASMARCDVFDRGLPWTRLLLRYRRADNTLNLTRTDLWSAVSACAFPVLLIASGWIPLLLLPAALAAVAFAALQRPFYRFLAESHGPGFLPRALLLHILHFQCAAAGFALGILAACLCGHVKPGGGEARCS